MSKEHRISDYIGVAPRFLRSVNLASDWQHPSSCEGYVLTQNIALALERLRMELAEASGQRAFTLIGPYGTGKSAFAVYLCQLFSRSDEDAAKANSLLANDHSELADKIEKVRVRGCNRRGFLPIAVTARRRPIAQLLLEGIGRAVSELDKTASTEQLAGRIQVAQDKDYWTDTATVLQFLGELGNEAKAQGFAGQLLLVDEAGKTLEYALQDRQGGDVYVFQEIAEYANREREFPLLFLITLHQMFDDYVELAERTIRAEWTKVQERFQAIQFTESAAATIQMLADAIQRTRPLPTKISQAVTKALRQLDKASAPMPIGLDRADFQDMARRAWPLHPTVLLAMPHLFRRLAQNERSIFSYLTSHEPFGFQGHLEKPLDTDSGFVRLHDLYAYLLANFETGIARLPHAKRLLEANDVINSRHNLSSGEHDLICTVAMLNVLGDICPLRASLKLLECAAPPGVEVEAALIGLKQQSILTYRRLDTSFRVWEGSDVDIDARMKEARRHLRMEGSSLLETLQSHLPQRTFVARRHSLETGAHRFFSVSYVGQLEKPESYHELELADGASGKILVVLLNADASVLHQAAEKATTAQPRLIVALPRQIDALRAVVEDVACLRWVERNTEELRDDRVARRELSLRLVEGEQRMAQLLQTLLDPRPAPAGNSCQWFWRGVDRSPRSPFEVTKLLSTACDQIYSQGARIRNELIARRTISSAAAAARRSLMERMLMSADSERLGIDGFPPERSIYESVLRAAGLHVYDQTKGAWLFQAPPADNPINLRPAWTLLEQELFVTDVKRCQLQSVFSQLAQAPYGLPSGIHPILFTAFYLVNQDSLFLYRENSFVPDPQPAHFELLQRRPDLFSISGARLDGIRRSVIERLASGLDVTPTTVSVVRALFRIINNLPPVTLNSSKLEAPHACGVRDKFLHALSPEELLFRELPCCFGMKPFLQSEERTEDIDVFFGHLNVCLNDLQMHASDLRDQMQNILLNECGLSPSQEGWGELERRALWLGPRLNQQVLTPFLNSIKNGKDDNHNPSPALSNVAGRSFDQWTDQDVERFAGWAEGVGAQFRQAWRDYGDPRPELSEIEVRQKARLRNELEPYLRKIQRESSANALRVVLSELLQDLEDEITTAEGVATVD